MVHKTEIKDETNLIPKKHNHDHYWIEKGVLYESYRTLRGLRYLPIKDVPGMPNIDECSKKILNFIAKEYYT